MALGQSGRLEEAVREFRKALQIKPVMGVARSRLGIALRSLDRTGEAVTELRKAVRLTPGDAEAHYNLALALHGGVTGRVR